MQACKGRKGTGDPRENPPTSCIVLHDSPFEKIRDKIDAQHIYTEVTFAIGSQFIRHALDDPGPIAYLQGNKRTSAGLRGVLSRATTFRFYCQQLRLLTSLPLFTDAADEQLTGDPPYDRRLGGASGEDEIKAFLAILVLPSGRLRRVTRIALMGGEQAICSATVRKLIGTCYKVLCSAASAKAWVGGEQCFVFPQLAAAGSQPVITQAVKHDGKDRTFRREGGVGGEGGPSRLPGTWVAARRWRGSWRGGERRRFATRRPDKFVSSTTCRLDSTALRADIPISTAHWLPVITVEGDDWASVLQEVSGTPFVHTVFDTSRRTLTQSSPSTVTADNQCAVNIGISVHKTVECSLANFSGLATRPSLAVVRILSKGNSSVQLESTVMCILEPQMFVHWLLPHRVGSVTPDLAV
ncbi:hypothetical protein PR048_029496 [Dryococelus australis]|uniref:Uncharacterized protein n=1 Tax=Dryococelus australis TaxID=614101 RepID=A0ABQ9GDJ9_9NEOP|nr:hypothetical protein PR048_029496 [Dryococelus australis]